MNIGSLIPVAMPIEDMRIAASPPDMLAFDRLMPAADPAKIVAVAAVAQNPAGAAVSATDIHAQLPPVAFPTAATSKSGPTQCSGSTLQMSDYPENAAVQSLPVQNTPPAPTAKLVTNAPPPFAPVFDDAPGAPDDDAEEFSDCDEMLLFGTQQSDVPVSTIALPLGPSVDLKPAQPTAQSDPEIAGIADLSPKPPIAEKSANWGMPVQAAFEIAQPAAVAERAHTAEPIATRHLDLASDALWLDQLTREIVAVASNDGRLKFSLSPAALGNLDVAISTQADGVNIQLQPSSETAARIFATEQPKLVEELRHSGIKLANNDLLSGQHMGSASYHSQQQRFDRPAPPPLSGQRPIVPTPASTLTSPPRARFA